jgi:hypothetical protein
MQKNASTSLAIVRPSNTTAYTALDVIGVADVDVAANAGSAVLEFPTMGPAGGSLTLDEVILLIALAAVPGSMTTFRLHLFDAAPTAILDNAAMDIPAGDRTKYLGFVDLVAPVDMGATLISQTTGLNRPLKLAAGSTSLFGLLATTGGFTPTSGEAYRLTLKSRTGV